MRKKNIYFSRNTTLYRYSVLVYMNFLQMPAEYIELDKRYNEKLLTKLQYSAILAIYKYNPYNVVEDTYEFEIYCRDYIAGGIPFLEGYKKELIKHMGK